MTKPRYTNDNAPLTDDPNLKRFLDEQFQRIYDLWPQDVEARLDALEREFPYIGGTWPIVQEFLFKATEYEVGEVFTISLMATKDTVTEGFISFDGIPPVFANGITDINRAAPGQGMAADNNGTIVGPITNSSDFVVSFDNGETWETKSTNPYGGGDWLYWNGDFYCNCYQSTNEIKIAKATSSDFSTFSLHGSGIFGVPAFGPGYSVDFDVNTNNGNYWGACTRDPSLNGSVVFSVDGGVTWAVNSQGTIAADYPKYFGFLNNAWYWVTNGGSVYRSGSASAGAATFSLLTGITTNVECIAYGDGKWVIHGQGGTATLWQSSDGISFTAVSATNGPLNSQSRQSIEWSETYQRWTCADTDFIKVSDQNDLTNWTTVYGPITRTRAVKWVK